MDSWVPGAGGGIQTWYDVTFFSSDSIPVTENYPIIAEMYFRIKTDTILHERQVYSLMDWLGDLVGIDGLLYQLLFAFFGGYL